MLFRNFRDLNRLLMEMDPFVNLNALTVKEQTQTGSDEDGDWEKRTYVSDSGLFSYTYFTKKSNKSEKIDESTKLKSELDKCVEEQDFERAVELRDKIKKVEETKEDMVKLNDELNECIKKQDFEGAIIVRDKINSLK